MYPWLSSQVRYHCANSLWLLSNIVPAGPGRCGMIADECDSEVSIQIVICRVWLWNIFSAFTTYAERMLAMRNYIE